MNEEKRDENRALTLWEALPEEQWHFRSMRRSCGIDAKKVTIGMLHDMFMMAGTIGRWGLYDTECLEKIYKLIGA